MNNFWLTNLPKPEYVADADRCVLYTTMLSATGSGAEADPGSATGMTVLPKDRQIGLLRGAFNASASEQGQPNGGHLGQRPNILG
jgi:hypothetical protein